VTHGIVTLTVFRRRRNGRRFEVEAFGDLEFARTLLLQQEELFRGQGHDGDAW
jgi:hypothetical protein